MKKKTPNLPEVLEEAGDFSILLSEAKREETDILRTRIENVSLQNADLSRVSFRETIFENCRFLNCSFQKGSFIDVRFCRCDFSGGNFEDGYFCRCELQCCKWMGAGLQNCGIQDVSICGSNLKYSRFGHSVLNSVHIAESDFSEADFSECRLKDFYPEGVRFQKAAFFKTSLRGIDFTSNQIDGIVVSDGFAELRGAVVNLYQAAGLAGLLGVIIQ